VRKIFALRKIRWIYAFGIQGKISAYIVDLIGIYITSVADRDIGFYLGTSLATFKTKATLNN